MKIAIAIILSLVMIEAATKMSRSHHSYHERDDEENRHLRHNSRNFNHRHRNVKRTLRQIRHKPIKSNRRRVSRHRRTYNRVRHSRKLSRNSRKPSWRSVQYPTPTKVDYEIKTNYTSAFNKFKSFCNDINKSCNDNCRHDYCDIMPESLYCTRCSENCRSASYNPCHNFDSIKYNPQEILSRRFIIDFNSDTINKCEHYEKRHCARSCGTEYCEAYPQSSECNLCLTACKKVGDQICKQQPNVNIQNSLRMTQRRNFIITYTNTFKDAPLVSSRSSEFCKYDCNTNYCYLDPEAYKCKECGTACRDVAQNYTKLLSNYTETSLRYFNIFFDENHKCTRTHREIVGLCMKSSCNHLDPYQSSCLDCIRGGIIGAKQACMIKMRKNTKIQEIFTGIVPFFSNPPLDCNDCSDQYTEICNVYCGRDTTCKQQCGQPGEMACISRCSGDKRHLYRDKFYQPMMNQFKVRIETCESCRSFCEMDWLRYCYEGDLACKSEWTTLCNFECGKSFCQKFRDEFGRKRSKIVNSKILYEQELILTIQRQKRRQLLRLDYDEKKTQKIQELAIRLQRDAIFDSIKLMEGLIYSDQAKLTTATQKKEDEFESETMKKIYAAYMTAEKLRAVTNLELRIFD